MLDILIPIGISVALVLIETIGIFVSKWSVAKNKIDNDYHTELKSYLAANQGTLNQETIGRKMKDIKKKVRRKCLTGVINGILPGPELCFLSLTVMVSLFLAYNYANETIRKAICPPLLAGTNNVYPVFLLAVILYIVIWLGLMIWREAIAAGVQEKFIKRSSFAITVSGAATITSCISLLFYGR